MGTQTYSGGFPVQREHERGRMFDHKKHQVPFRGLNRIRSSKSGSGSRIFLLVWKSAHLIQMDVFRVCTRNHNNHLETDPRNQEAQLSEDEPRWVRRLVDRRGQVKMEEKTHKTLN